MLKHLTAGHYLQRAVKANRAALTRPSVNVCLRVFSYSTDHTIRIGLTNPLGSSCYKVLIININCSDKKKNIAIFHLLKNVAPFQPYNKADCLIWFDRQKVYGWNWVIGEAKWRRLGLFPICLTNRYVKHTAPSAFSQVFNISPGTQMLVRPNPPSPLLSKTFHPNPLKWG